MKVGQIIFGRYVNLINNSIFAFLSHPFSSHWSVFILMVLVIIVAIKEHF